MTRWSAKVELGRQVVDQEDRCYTLGELLGEGGQGVVHRVKQGAFAVKLLYAKDQLAGGKFRRRLQAVRRLDIAGLPIATPLSLLKAPQTGYVMKLVAGFRPIATLMRPSDAGDHLTEHYLKTGGLRGRLQRLAALADILAKLHSRGIVFGDPSPGNILVTKPDRPPGVFLIDPDNLSIDGVADAPETYTPGYGAPELVCGKSGVSTLTDAHAFAVLAFETLTLQHPFLGDMVEDGDPEIEEEALRGGLPWIGHGSDLRNRATAGLPQELVATLRMQTLFTQAFEEGLGNSSRRPGLSAWREAFVEALGGVVDCEACGGGFFSDRFSECSWCDASAPTLHLVKCCIWSPDLLRSEKSSQFVKDVEGELKYCWSLAVTGGRPTCVLRQQALSDPTPESAFSPVVELQLASQAKIRIRNTASVPFWLRKEGSSQPGGERLAPGGEATVPLRSPKPWFLHFGEADSVHRAVQF